MEYVVPVFYTWINRVEVIRNDNEIVSKEDLTDAVKVDKSYFNMLPYTWLAGNKEAFLSNPNSVVLTESRSKEYFPNLDFQDMLHQSVTYYGFDTVQRTVTGIVADYDTPSEFTAKEFLALTDEVYNTVMWTNTNGSDKLYIQLKEGVNKTVLLEQINQLSDRKWAMFEQERGNALPRSKYYQLLSLPELHFATHVNDNGVSKTSKPVMYGLVGIGIFLLLLACINYVNLSLAQIPQRSKEIGIRKALGISQQYVIGQFLIETFLTTFIACLLAFLFGQLGFWLLKDIIPIGVTLYDTFLSILLFMLGVILLITLIAGLYPAWLITKVRTISILNNTSVVPSAIGKFSLQKALIIFQFVIALVFIISSIIVGAQLRYTIKRDMGFNKDAIVLVNVPWKYLGDPEYKDKQFPLLNQLKNTSGIENITMGTPPLSNGYSSSPFELNVDGKDPIRVKVFKKTIDTAYLGLYQMDILAGRNIRPSDTINEFIINESAAKAFGFLSPHDALGKEIGQLGNNKFAIAAVVKDFHMQDFYTPIEPLVMMSYKENLSTFNIKLDSRNPDQWQAALKSIEEEWKKFYPAEMFQYRFYDQTLEAIYNQERQINKLINLATAISIIVSCLGLFGLATLTAYQRVKEIGVRKVLGSSVMGIVQLLSKDFVKLVLIAILIASPIAWWAMNKWLQDFAYRINIKWWMFALAGGMSVVIALLTVSFQSVKAAIANPVDSLRDELGLASWRNYNL